MELPSSNGQDRPLVPQLWPPMEIMENYKQSLCLEAPSHVVDVLLSALLQLPSDESAKINRQEEWWLSLMSWEATTSPSLTTADHRKALDLTYLPCIDHPEQRQKDGSPFPVRSSIVDYIWSCLFSAQSGLFDPRPLTDRSSFPAAQSNQHMMANQPAETMITSSLSSSSSSSERVQGEREQCAFAWQALGSFLTEAKLSPLQMLTTALHHQGSIDPSLSAITAENRTPTDFSPERKSEGLFLSRTSSVTFPYLMYTLTRLLLMAASLHCQYRSSLVSAPRVMERPKRWQSMVFESVRLYQKLVETWVMDSMMKTTNITSTDSEEEVVQSCDLKSYDDEESRPREQHDEVSLPVVLLGQVWTDYLLPNLQDVQQALLLSVNPQPGGSLSSPDVLPTSAAFMAGTVATSLQLIRRIRPPSLRRLLATAVKASLAKEEVLHTEVVSMVSSLQKKLDDSLHNVLGGGSWAVLLRWRQARRGRRTHPDCTSKENAKAITTPSTLEAYLHLYTTLTPSDSVDNDDRDKEEGEEEAVDFHQSELMERLAYMRTEWDEIGLALWAARTWDCRPVVYSPKFQWLLWFPQMLVLLRHAADLEGDECLTIRLMQGLLGQTPEVTLSLPAASDVHYPLDVLSILASNTYMIAIHKKGWGPSGMMLDDPIQIYLLIKSIVSKYVPMAQVDIVRMLMTIPKHNNLRPKFIDLWRSFVDWTDPEPISRVWEFLDNLFTESFENHIVYLGSDDGSDDAPLLKNLALFIPLIELCGSALGLVRLWLLVRKEPACLHQWTLRISTFQLAVRNTLSGSIKKPDPIKQESDQVFRLGLLDMWLQEQIDTMQTTISSA